MEDLKFEMLISFIREEIGEFDLEIKKDTLIEDELGLTGDDGIELICNYSKKFNVDITDFKFDKYFHPEPGIFNTFKKTILPIRINDLYNGIINGKLV
jgi:acyl carrier protein